jgi:hypothetical protein
MVTEMPPLFERSDLNRFQEPPFWHKHVVDVKWLALTMKKVQGRARLGSLLLGMMSVVRTNQTVRFE